MDFTARYQKLNQSQHTAVDTIDGPVMVVAGPGTGKTELLGMRAANILQKTDTLPESILCLTFTDSGAIAMRKRLVDIIGKDAYNVSIFTFHSFGSEIISRFREYFYHGADFSPSDTINQHEIITSLLTSLNYDDPLTAKMNGVFTAAGDIKRAISDIKRSGLSTEEMRTLLDATEKVTQHVEPKLTAIFDQKITKYTTAAALSALVPEITAIDDSVAIPDIPRFSAVLAASITRALEASAEDNDSTKPITTWKNQWTTANPQKQRVFKTTLRITKLRSLLHVYDLYTQVMEQASLYDYDDMIMQLVHALEQHDELRYELQEKYQYIMVDEFQDTNLAQMRILHSLTNNPVAEGSPNILVVGDDDQAIYGFQGADVGNILGFRERFPNAKLITLTDNYRSTEPILSAARDIITQGADRLEDRIDGLSKALTSHSDAPARHATIIATPSQHQERLWVVADIARRTKAGERPQDIAVIGRSHNDIKALLPYFDSKNITVSYEQRNNVLDDDVVKQLVLLARVVVALYENRLGDANALLPELLCSPAWGIDPATMWQLSLRAYNNRQQWLETLQATTATKPLAEWLIDTARLVPIVPLERMLDRLIGHEGEDAVFISPLKDFYFSSDHQAVHAGAYMHHLENMRAIRVRLRDHHNDDAMPTITLFLEFVDRYRELGQSITTIRQVGDEEISVNLLTAHASKGLEFTTVYIINAVDSVWGATVRSRSSSISFPEHLRLQEKANTLDERLRLFYVAMTRARQNLVITQAQQSDAGKELLMTEFLVEAPSLEQHEAATLDDDVLANTEASALQQWYSPLVHIPSATMEELLAPTLKTYKLSATHLNAFTNVTRGGPQQFLINNLLHFPSAPSAAASYGTAIHATLQRAHDYIKAHNGEHQAAEDLLVYYETTLRDQRLTADEIETYLKKGRDALVVFLSHAYDTFSPRQQAELSFASQEVFVDDARLTGKLDVAAINPDEQTIIVTDYKTGKAVYGWDKGSAYDKTKVYLYRQQLLFYKLLVERSRDWRSYTMPRGILQFVEPDASGVIHHLALEPQKDEVERFEKLVTAVWRHIQDLSFPDTSNYDDSVKGIQQFESDLIDGKI